MMTSENPQNLKALVFGASGITGWAIAHTSLSYPTTTTFSRVIGLTNRPLSTKDSYLPPDPRLSLHSGVDLSGDENTISDSLSKINGVSEVTHVYFAAYIHHGWGANQSEKRNQTNIDMLLNTLKVIDKICPDLQFVTWATGGKWYGFEHSKTLPLHPPMKESDPRVPPPIGDHIFYYGQHDAISAFAKSKRWTFADIRPDAIVGFVPNNNPMNIAQPIGLYLSLWKFVNPNQPVPFPGTKASYTHLHSDCFQDQVAKMHIFVSLHPEKTAGGSFNIADTGEPQSWEMIWPGICRYFGLEAAGPPESGSLAGEAWVFSRQADWPNWADSHGIKKDILTETAWDFLTAVAGEFSEVDRYFDISLAKDLGYSETIDHVDGYHRTFDRMRLAGFIPE